MSSIEETPEDHDPIGEEVKIPLSHNDFQQVEVDGFIRTYASIVEIQGNPYDFQFIFGEYDFVGSAKWAQAKKAGQPLPEGERRPRYLKKCAVTVSPEHAKRIHKFLGKRINEWEDEHGENYRMLLNDDLNIGKS